MTETIFINTSNFMQENFMKGDRIKTLLDLAKKGHVNVGLEIPIKFRFTINDQEVYDPCYAVLGISKGLDIDINPDGFDDYY
jgi:hypothetical protein